MQRRPTVRLRLSACWLDGMYKHPQAAAGCGAIRASYTLFYDFDTIPTSSHCLCLCPICLVESRHSGPTEPAPYQASSVGGPEDTTCQKSPRSSGTPSEQRVLPRPGKAPKTTNEVQAAMRHTPSFAST